jgi:hypothetical protein
MQKTRILGSFKGIFPPIHQPLPLSKRESQRLLNAIKTSFRQQLDREHGVVSRSTLRAALAADAASEEPSNSAPSSASSPADDQTPTRPTDRHIQALLRNPIFNPDPFAPTLDPVGSYSVLVDKHKAIFRKAVARGLMNIPRAHGFLLQVQNAETQSKTLSSKESPPRTGAGILVAQWLRSSGQEQNLSFLANRPFTRLLVPFMVVDGKEEVVWSWIERLMDRLMKGDAAGETSENSSTATNIAMLLDSLIRSKSLSPKLNPAYQAMLKAESLVKDHHIPTRMLRPAWHTLAYETTVSTTIVRRQQPLQQLFDPFVAMGEELGSAPIEMAHLDLHHPAKPSAERAIEYISNEASYKVEDRVAEYICPYNSDGTLPNSETVNRGRYWERLRVLGIDTVQHLMETNEVKEASRVWDLLSQHLGTMFPEFRGQRHLGMFV